MSIVLGVFIGAGTSYLLGNSIGLGGGAIYGGIWGLTDKAIVRLIGDEHKLLCTIASVVSAWKLTALCGVVMTLESVVLLSITCVVVFMGVGEVCQIAHQAGLIEKNYLLDFVSEY